MPKNGFRPETLGILLPNQKTPGNGFLGPKKGNRNFLEMRKVRFHHDGRLGDRPLLARIVQAPRRVKRLALTWASPARSRCLAASSCGGLGGRKKRLAREHQCIAERERHGYLHELTATLAKERSSRFVVEEWRNGSQPRGGPAAGMTSQRMRVIRNGLSGKRAFFGHLPPMTRNPSVSARQPVSSFFTIFHHAQALF